MMTFFHPKIKLSLYIDRQLSQREIQRLEKHLAVCTKCQSLLQKMRMVTTTIKINQTCTVSPYFTPRILALYHQHTDESSFWLGFERVPRLLPELAIILIIVLALLWTWPPFYSSTIDQIEARTAASILLNNTEVDTTLNTYDQALQFALSDQQERIEGGKK